jgi:hypothetical protein
MTRRLFSLMAICLSQFAPQHGTAQVAPRQTPAAGQPVADSQPGNLNSVGRRRLQPLPAIGSAPETGLQYGATLLGVFEPAPDLQTRPSSILGYALRTAKAQTRVGLETEYWTRGNARRWAATAVWQEFPLPFYGIGGHTVTSAEETFVPKGVEAVLALHQRVKGTWYATSGIRHINQTITPDTVGVLRAGTITGSRGGRSTEFSLGVLTDTRDNLFAPRAGRLVHVSYAQSVSGALSNYGYGRLRVDARDYRGNRAHHVMALQIVVVGMNGDAPFDQLALVGGSDIMRGYAKGRYRDQWLAAAQTEYRSPVRHRLGAVVFAGAGMTFGASVDSAARQWLPTYGAGLRVQIDQRQRTSVRADYGRGRDGASGLYIGFNQAF